MSERRRVGWGVVLALLVVLAGTAYVAWQTHEGFLASLEPHRGPPAPPAPDAATTYVHHSWVVDAGPPAPTPRTIPATPEGIDPAALDEVYDPQRWAMLREFHAVDGDAGASLPFAPIEREAQVAERQGLIPVEEGATCRVRVLPARNSQFNCLARVICGGRVVYPNPTQTAGYVACELDAEGAPVRAEDVGHSALDGDPRLRFDLASGEVVVSDAGDGVDRFRLTLRLR
ncbi:MAG: hypothetical protein KC619_34925 [Myxococcales bacterium]|nr:hypothetical protein [Myxococcales bacterium]